MSLFDRAVERVLEHEGGYVDDPLDRGGETNFGITARTLRDARDSRIVGREATVATLTREQAIEIYRAMYWRRAGCDRLPGPLAVVVFDFAVNSGPATAVKALQRVLRVDDDGVLGEQTAAAARRTGERTVAQLCRARLELMADLIARAPEQKRFRGGWFARVAATAFFAGQVAARARAAEEGL